MANPMTRRVWLSPRIILVLAMLTGLGTVILHDVPTKVTVEDRDYASRILTAAGYPGHAEAYGDLNGFDGQVRAALAVQDAVLGATPKSEGLPLGQAREPHDVFEAQRGLCFDRSRVIEKILGHLGLETRHLSVFSTKDGRSKLAAMLGDTTKSHAVSEVRTARGWMLVDSNARWIGLDASRRPVDAASLRNAAIAGGPWAPESTAKLNHIFTGPFTFVIGLYSRHGRFYWPYTPVPDYNLGQLVQNMW